MSNKGKKSDNVQNNIKTILKRTGFPRAPVALRRNEKKTPKRLFRKSQAKKSHSIEWLFL